MRIDLAADLRREWALQKALGGRLIALPSMPILGISTNSEQVQRGDLFVALRGEHTQGLCFVDQALEKGAAAVLCDTEIQLPTGVGLVLHEEPQQALLDAAAWYRRQCDVKVIAVSGSAGKTTVKEAIAAVLGDVPHSEGNFNSTVGMPLSVLSVPRAPYWVLELGINHVGEMEKMARALAPDVGVLTNVGTAHVGNFGDFCTLLAEKTAMADHLRPGGVMLLPSDLAYVLPQAPLFSTVRFGTGGEVFAEKIVNDENGVRCDLHGFGRVITNLTWPVPGRIGVCTLCAVGAVCLWLGQSDDHIRAGLQRAAAQTPRMRRIVQNGRILLDDCYNASPEAMMAALEVLSIVGKGRQQIAVLGDMLELGAHSAALHDALGAYVAQNGDVSLFTWGEDAARIASGALRGGLLREKVQHFEKDASEALIAAVCRSAGEDAVILFKASRALRMERILEGVRRML